MCVAAGDEQGFARFFDEYYRRLYRFALARLGGDQDGADEMAQRTLCRACRKLHQYRGEASLFTWLCQICRHEIHDHAELRNRDARRLVSIDDDPALDKVDFYSGVLPVEYGDRMSAVLDMRTRPAAERFGGRASLGTMHASAMLEGTLPGARGDWLAFARRSLLDHIARLVAPELGGPRLSDALGRVRYHLRDGSVVMVGGLAADDDIELAVRDGIEVSRGESDRSYVWSALDTQWGSSAVRTLLTHASSGIDRFGQLQDPAGSTGAVIDRRRILTTMLRQDWRRPLARNGALRWGASGRRDHVDYEYSREVSFPAQVAALYAQDISSRFDLTTVAKLTEYEAYAGMSEELGARWSVEGGLHWTHADYSTDQAGPVWDPRIALLYRVSPATRVRLAWGRMTQT
ncbi:MAG: TonB-dependent receptor domain-containing protein, partial [Steroidobacteraceae bacterium]